MKKILFVIANYPDERQSFYETYMRPNNKKYCDKHGFEYYEFNGNEEIFRNHPTWWKFSIVRDMIEDGYLKREDVCTHIDADMCIVDHSVGLVSNKSFSYAIDSCNTHCMGLYSLRVNDWSKELLNNILDDKRYEKYKDLKTIGSMNESSSFWEIFREQASWYSLAGIQRHSWTPFILMKHYGWHSNKNEDTVYSLEELYKNVEILNTNWNVTHIPEEDGQNQFYMIPTKPEHTVVRHFAAGRQWRKEYFKT